MLRDCVSRLDAASLRPCAPVDLATVLSEVVASARQGSTSPRGSWPSRCGDWRFRRRRNHWRPDGHLTGAFGSGTGAQPQCGTLREPGASLPSVKHWGWRGAPAPSNPRPGGVLPGPPNHPAHFPLSSDGYLDGARGDSRSAGVGGRAGRVARQGAGGVPLSELLRRGMARTRTCTAAAAVERKRSRELSRIGKNLNQLARWANTQKEGAEAVTAVIQYLSYLFTIVIYNCWRRERDSNPR